MDKIFDKFYEICEKFIKNEKLMNLIRKVISKEVVSYLFFGVLTTVVALITFGFFNKFVDVLISNVISWIAAVTFAYITNKLFVFDSKSWKWRVISKEIPSFAGARLVTLGIEEAGLIILIKWLHLDVPLTLSFISGEMVIKIFISIIVVILNYVFSKILIFKKK